MIGTLIQFKRNLEEQGFEHTSLAGIHHYVDSLINLMEVLANNIVTLQDNASEMATQFTNTDAELAAMYHTSISDTTSYQTYETKQMEDLYGKLD